MLAINQKWKSTENEYDDSTSWSQHLSVFDHLATHLTIKPLKTTAVIEKNNLCSLKTRSSKKNAHGVFSYHLFYFK